MKCIKFRDYVRRVPDSVAKQRVEKEGWKYTNKHEWKKAGRP